MWDNTAIPAGLRDRILRDWAQLQNVDSQLREVNAAGPPRGLKMAGNWERWWGMRLRKIGIVALARKLLVALRRYLETGAVPDGATLKPVAG